MNYAESELVGNLETGLDDVTRTGQTAVLEKNYSYDAAFMVGCAQPTLLVDGTSSDTEALESNILTTTTRAYTISAASEETASSDDGIAEVEQLTVEQASKILAISKERVKELIENDTLCCSDTGETGEPRLSAACVRAQAGKSKLEFVQEIKRLIAGENNKKRKASVDMPSDADVCLQELFDASSPFGAIEPAEKVSKAYIRGIDRAEITNKNLESVLENLDFSSVRLEGAMYRIGYLEAKLDNLQKELEIMPELRSKWAKSLILERENEEYKETIARREHELLEVHQMLDKIKESWWCRAWCWFTGITLK